MKQINIKDLKNQYIRKPILINNEKGTDILFYNWEKMPQKKEEERNI